MTDDIQQQEVGSGGSAGQTGGAVNSPASTGADGSAALALQEQTQTAMSDESASESGNTTDSADTHGGSAEAEADESEANPESEPTDSDSVDDAAEEILEEGASRSNSYLSGLKGVTIPNTTPFYSDKVQRGRHFSDKTAIRADDPNLDDGMKKIFAMLDENASAYYEKQDAQKPKLFPESSYEAKPEETLPSDSSLAELAQQSARINSRDDVQIEASLGLKPGDLENFDDFDDFDDERKKTYATLTGTLTPISAPIPSEGQNAIVAEAGENSSDVSEAGNVNADGNANVGNPADNATATGTTDAAGAAEGAPETVAADTGAAAGDASDADKAAAAAGDAAESSAQAGQQANQPTAEFGQTSTREHAAQAQSTAPSTQATQQQVNTPATTTTNESHTMNEQQSAAQTQTPTQTPTAEQMQALQAQYLAQQQAAQARQQQYAAYQQAMLQQMQAQQQASQAQAQNQQAAATTTISSEQMQAYQQRMQAQAIQAQQMRQAQAARTGAQQTAQGNVSYQQVNLQAPTFVVPPTDDSGKNNAVLKKRREKAQLVAQTMFREHPDADTEFINAVYRLVELNASDLHLVVGDNPMLRVDGRLTPVPESQVWDKERTLAAVQVMTTDEELQRFEQELELDVSFAIGDLVRFRVNVYQDRNGVCAALRTIPLEIKTVTQLGLDQRIADLALLPRGLVLVCGPTGSGKSTTLAAIVDKANAERHDHIITIEDPIEFVHRHKNCVVSQREVGTDTLSFAEALKHALREDPDIIMVGELRDLETISTALTAVETGHLVFATLHTQDAGSTVDRLIDVYPENQQQQIRVQVASTLRAVIVQTLLPKASGHGRVPATEVMYATPAISALIREGKTHQVRTQLQSGGDLGMHTLDQDLARLVNRGDVQLDIAEKRCQDRKEFEKLVQARAAY
ncbi:type IV pilus twitching motility protein PilT [Bifidobacterium thermophilum]|uniref:type IV pilus twitching motility protein PilT n=1 Tax=Bifidobacterium thermophilum TaxID=33905 RepID=UPI003990FFAA